MRAAIASRALRAPSLVLEALQRRALGPTLPLVGRVAREARGVGVVWWSAEGTPPPTPPHKGEGSRPSSPLGHATSHEHAVAFASANTAGSPSGGPRPRAGATSPARHKGGACRADRDARYARARSRPA